MSTLFLVIFISHSSWPHTSPIPLSCDLSCLVSLGFVFHGDATSDQSRELTAVAAATGSIGAVCRSKAIISAGTPDSFLPDHENSEFHHKVWKSTRPATRADGVTTVGFGGEIKSAVPKKSTQTKALALLTAVLGILHDRSLVEPSRNCLLAWLIDCLMHLFVSSIPLNAVVILVHVPFAS